MIKILVNTNERKIIKAIRTNKKSCYIAKDSDSEEDEMVYIVVKDDS